MLTMVFVIALARLPQRIVFQIPPPLSVRAKLKAQLCNDLFASVKNDSESVLDLRLEKEIEKLEIQLLKGKGE